MQANLIFLMVIVLQSPAFALDYRNDAAGTVEGISGVNNLVREVALVTPENRKIRTRQNTEDLSPLSIESVQGRIWCWSRGKRPRDGEIPSKSELRQNYSNENATVVFENDIVLLNRHMFLNVDGSRRVEPENCFFEHIMSGQVIRATKHAVYEPLNFEGGKAIQSAAEDFALLRLSAPARSAVPITEKDMVIDSPRRNGTTLVMLSNYDVSLLNGNPESLTIQSCILKENMGTPGGSLSNTVGTDCNGDHGSSGAQIYIIENGSPKLFAILVGGAEYAPKRSGYKTNVLCTWVVRFDYELLGDYQDLPSR